MSAASEAQITHVLLKAGAGDPQAAEDLLPLVYEQLRNLARARLAKEPPGQTLQPTALVHEAYLRLIGDQDPGWNSRGHFFGAAARAMRRILIEQARRKGRLRHGGAHARVGLESIEVGIQPPGNDLLAVDEALTRLEAQDPRKGQIVNLRYFAGLTEHEVADVLGVSVATVQREWRFCRRWLFTELNRSDLERDEQHGPSSA